MPVVGIDLGRNDYAAGGAPGPGVAAGGDVDFTAMPSLSISHLKRAMVLIANALPDTAGAAVGLIHALVRKTAVDWVDPLDYSDTLGASPVPVACVCSHLIMENSHFPSPPQQQVQSMLPLSEERSKTKGVTETACSLLDGDSFAATLSSSAIFSAMLAGAVSQALRYIGVMPASLWAVGAWPHPARLRNVLTSLTLFAAHRSS